MVKEGAEIKVEKLPDELKKIEFDDILHQKKVIAEIVDTKKGKKITGVKFKKRKGYLKFFGHRQTQTVLRILKIK
ncbi:MAG: 50S ribosomal protein L21 [Candidatus Berkelbacteria bacterium Licking1014_7]|uniref:50S ribosomal protein L21 n=1 Tax=Candidatus Berkelbacteria bacterium Licking1014_7 TaxID=2017147 RepID=A0A554LHX9_9BACT|nr:MAG: 50S ribosomal protein L21 [Candidatus Berkelbacteria bacterium Licking1014_7]